MSKTISWLKKRLTAILGLIVLVVAIIIIPWRSVWQSVSDLDPLIIAALVALSLVYFLAKALRFHLILSQLGFRQSVRLATLIYWGAQPVTFLPGGEFYRTVLFEKHASIPPARTSSAVVFQGLIELVTLIAVTFVAVLLRGMFLRQVLALAVIVLAIILVLTQGWLPKAKWLNKLPFVHLNQQKITRFRADNKVLLERDSIIRFIIISFVPILAGIGIVGLSALGLGLHLSIVEMVLAYTIPVVVSYVAIIPGFGEGGGIGTLLLFGVALAPAIAVMLLFKLFTQGMGLVLGPIALLQLRRSAARKDAHA